MSLCIRPEDVVGHPGGPTTTEGLTDHELIDRAAAHNEFARDLGTRRLKMIRQVYESGGKHLAHSHVATEQAYYVLEGEGRVRIEEEEFEVGPGTVVYLPPGAEHEMVNTGTGRLVNLLIAVELD